MYINMALHSSSIFTHLIVTGIIFNYPHIVGLVGMNEIGTVSLGLLATSRWCIVAGIGCMLAAQVIELII